MEPVRFCLLGPLEVQTAEGPLEIGGPKERAVLAILLLNANEVVAHDTLIEGLWSAWPPGSARHTLSAHVSRLRRHLAGGGLESSTIETRPGGYTLRCRPEQLDLLLFERLYREGSHALDGGAPDAALELLDRALGLWRGEPLSDVAGEPFAAPEITRLEELRLRAVEGRIGAALVLGRESDVLPELESLVARHPHHERLRAQLMTALYRTGRQVEALDVYREGRQRLVDDFGIEPGEELQELQRAILTHDSAIDGEIGPAAAPIATREPAQPRRGRLGERSRWTLAALAASLAALVALLLVVVGGEGGSTFSGPGLVSLDPGTRRTTPFASTAASPGDVVQTADSIWVAQPKRGTVLRFNRRRGSLIGTVKIGDQVGGLAVQDGLVWVASTEAGSVDRIDATGGVDRVVPVGNGPTAVAYGFGSIWVVNDHDRTLSRVDPAAGRVIEVIATDSTGPGLAVGAGGVWVADEPTGRVVEVDPRTNALAQEIVVGNGPTSIAVDQSMVWVANRVDGTVSSIDPRSGIVTATIRVGDSPSDVITALGTVWVANELSETVSQVARSTSALRTIAVGGGPTSLCAAGARIMVSIRGPD